MTSHELARKLFDGPDLPVQLSISNPKATAYTQTVTVIHDKTVVRVEGWVWSDDEDAFAPWGSIIDSIPHFNV